jgi:two-component sensor histidine kinase/DNA-binding response OmpR family regulator
MNDDKVNVLLVDDQPAKLLTYEAILKDLGENLITANGAREALEHLLKKDVAVVLIDVYMPETDGFQLAAMIREHPRFQKIAIIFISAILLTEVDRLRGYEMGAVDYVPVPVIPEVLRAKVKVFIELYRKTRQLEQLNRELEARVAERTAELAASTRQLRQSEQLRSLALAAGQMGTWDWDAVRGRLTWDQGQFAIFGVDAPAFAPSLESVKALIHPEDLERLLDAYRGVTKDAKTVQAEFRVRRPNGELRWCVGVAAASFDGRDRIVRLSGVTVDITDRKLAEDRQMLLAEEVDHRARNVVAVVQSIMRLTRADDMESYVSAVDGRIRALSNAHKLLSRSRWEGADLRKLVDEEFAPYSADGVEKVSINGPSVLLQPNTAQTLALAIHELATNAAKYGALSAVSGRVTLAWDLRPGSLELRWVETGGPKVGPPASRGYGTRVVTMGIESQLGGSVKFDWNRDGLRCMLSVPRDAKTEPLRKAPDESVYSIGGGASTTQSGAASLVLLVEDEPLVAMMLADMLSELGHMVDGPYSRLKDAMGAARNGDIQAGILDVNLGGESIYSLAEVLNSRGVPFVFVTGYSAESIDRRFAHIPVLQKPIERQKLQAILAGMSQPLETQPARAVGSA